MGKTRKFRGQRMTLQEFHAYAEAEEDGYRRWDTTKTLGDVLRRVPPSTFRIPKTLYHITHYSALPSIRRTGLDPGWRNARTGLNAKTGGDAIKYMTRDAYLTAVYLGTSSNVGTSMLPDEAAAEGGKVELAVKVPRWFTIRFMRYADAVISSESGTFDEQGTGSTILCFGIIVPAHIYVVDPRTSQHIRLTTLDTLDPDREYDFRPFATRPSDGEEPLLSNQELIEKKKRMDRMLEQARSLPSPTIPDTPPSPPADTAPQAPRFVIPQQFLDRLPQSSDEESSDEEWDET